MISLSNVVLQQGTQLLLENANLMIHAGQKVGVIGRNGCGKSSLFACLKGDLGLEQGDLSLPDGLRIASMTQETEGFEHSALDHVINGDRRFREVEQSLQQAETASDQQAIARLHAEMDRIDGYTIVHRAEKLLSGLGFETSEFRQPVRQFSGGWRVRLNLAAALMCPSDLLLLDEPTNHLDLEAQVWLENWLIEYYGTLLVISHDREFLDRIVKYIISFEQKKLQLYRGNYSQFETQQAARLAQEQALFNRQQRRRAEIEDFVRRFRAKASKARQAQSRLKELERMESIAAAHVDSPFRFHFRTPDRVPENLVSVVATSIGYDKPLASGMHLSIRSDSRIGLLGVNGSGKSTLLKVLAEELAPLDGEIIRAKHLAVGYFAQHQVDVLDDGASPLAFFLSLDPAAREQEVRDYLGGFDFQGDRVTTSIGKFSGGEKVRLALATIAWQRPNLLLLDEPTNHLDLEMRHALTVALQEFNGAIVVVSHDRHLLNNTVSEFFAFGNGRLSRFDGDLADYEKQVQGNTGAADNRAARPEAGATIEVDRKTQRQQAAARRAELAPLKRELKELESGMDDMVKRLSAIENSLLDQSLYDESNRQRLKALLKEQGELKARLADLEDRWLHVSEACQDQRT